jgi:hypothetical protein
MSCSEIQHSDLSWKELYGQMANLVAENEGNMGQLGLLMEARNRNYVTLTTVNTSHSLP